MVDIPLTHKGWWLFCPVYIGGLDTDGPLLVPRWFWLAPVYWLVTRIQMLVILACSIAREDYEPAWYFVVTGER